jgi:hypothetical protein
MREHTIQGVFSDRVVITPAEGDNTTTIAHLAAFTTFDSRLAGPAGTRPHCIAYDVLCEEWKHEFRGGNADYYDGFTARFADGSTLRVRM